MMLDSLNAGLTQLACTISPQQKQQLLGYLALLHKWNQYTNLTAIRDPKSMLVKHIFDSLTVLPFLQGARHIDVGTGGGLPGMVLAICLPDQHFTLLDSNGKKCLFLKQAQIELGLPNIDVRHQRVEQCQTTQPYDTVLSRAFTELSNMVNSGHALLSKHGRFLAMKSALAQHEVAALSKAWHATAHAVTVPQLSKPRVIIEIVESFGKID